MSSPSEPLLAWLRKQVKARGLNTAAVAEAIGSNRSHARKILAGAVPMTVDELLALGKVLELSPEDVGLPSVGAELPSEDETPDVPSIAPPSESGDQDFTAGVDPLGNHPEQIFRFGFALGCDFFFLARSEALTDSGIPAAVLAQHPDEFPIKLDAAYHRYNAPRYDEHGITITLSFDALYDCTFPWTAITRVIFLPEAPEAPEPESDDDDDDRPVLRLVT